YRLTLVWDGDLGRELCALPPRTFDAQPTAERFDAIRETDESRAGNRLRAADSVVAHDPTRKCVRPVDCDAFVCRLRVLRDVRDRLGDEVVDRRFDGVRQPVF